MPVAEEPSPKFHLYATMLPSGSVEAEASKLTGSGGGPLGGVAVAFAVGGRLAAGLDAVTTMGVLTALSIPLLSVTVKVAVYTPAVV